MRKMRFLTVLAAILLSCGIANAQTVKGDVNNDGKLNTLDVTAAADSIMDDKKSGLADVNEDQKVNAADVVSVVKLIQDTDYFMLGTEVPTKDNYTTVDGVVTTYESISKALEAAPTIEVAADKAGVLLCPSSWEAKDLVLQNEEDGTFYELAAAENDISDYDLFQTEMIAVATILKLKSKADAEAYKKIKETDFFYLGTQMPTKDNYTTLAGVVTTYKSIEDVLKDAPSLSIEYNERGYLLCPTSWDAKDLALQNNNNGEFFELTKAETDISGYTLFKTEEVEGGAVTTLKTKAAAEEYYAEKHPADDGKNWFWMGNYFPKANTFPTINGEEVLGIVKNYTSLDEAMANSARAYTANEYAVVLYPSKWGAKDDLVFIDNTNKKYYAVKKKEVSDFPDYIYYETAKKIGVNTTIFLSTESTAKDAGYKLYEEAAPVTPVTPETPVTPVTPPTPGGGNGVTFVLQNNCGKEVRLTGRVTLNISTNPTNWASSIQVPANPHGPQIGASWAYNDIIIPAGGSYTWTTNEIPAQYTSGSYYLMSTDKDQYNYSIYLYSRIWRTSKGKTEGSTGMYRVYPLQNARLQNGTTYYLNLYWANPEASLDPDRSGKYIILGYGKTSL